MAASFSKLSLPGGGPVLQFRASSKGRATLHQGVQGNSATSRSLGWVKSSFLGHAWPREGQALKSFGAGITCSQGTEVGQLPLEVLDRGRGDLSPEENPEKDVNHRKHREHWRERERVCV